MEAVANLSLHDPLQQDSLKPDSKPRRKSFRGRSRGYYKPRGRTNSPSKQDNSKEQDGQFKEQIPLKKKDFKQEHFVKKENVQDKVQQGEMQGDRGSFKKAGRGGHKPFRGGWKSKLVPIVKESTPVSN